LISRATRKQLSPRTLLEEIAAAELSARAARSLQRLLLQARIAHRAVTTGHSVLFRTASDLLADLQSDSPQIRRRKFNYYARPRLLCIDELAYLSYDSNAADLIFEIVNRRYEHGSILITSNRAFRDWNVVFPNATCIATLLDRLTHHADITLIEGKSYRVRESEIESLARKKTTPLTRRGSNET
jgi:DNA replication protein DnaC